MSGQKFNRWTIIGDDGGLLSQKRVLCRCDCGTKRSVILQTLINGRSKSCGCWKREVDIKRKWKHGKSKTRTFRIWDNMLGRATRPNHDSFADYGGRGITVCERWLTFSHFLEDMGECQPHEEIDRIDNDKGYCKENCRWTTRQQNVLNRRNTLYVSPLGVRMTLHKCAEIFHIQYECLRRRVQAGWNIAKALMLPMQKGGRGKCYS
jgi:hypothetical protein